MKPPLHGFSQTIAVTTYAFGGSRVWLSQANIMSSSSQTARLMKLDTCTNSMTCSLLPFFINRLEVELCGVRAMMPMLDNSIPQSSNTWLLLPSLTRDKWQDLLLFYLHFLWRWSMSTISVLCSLLLLAEGKGADFKGSFHFLQTTVDWSLPWHSVTTVLILDFFHLRNWI